ncbi:uncharacterized protein Dana_GF12335 [Drosophila ananassae]|uniref:FXNA-like protease n=1 Tax=Drosophila ananassae TaxID=7217 RepID=B3MGH3_DROAN|nr:endoplasmic reticulum metallopeptidase 1 [Drosophila ananassae]XP_032306195.1 endoplasmic reticulum metallopeptidase 1 [Drosophila ananassae]EDV35716.2 uncharacterized protein Dana_GF12335 [Drosophila ananassae]
MPSHRVDNSRSQWYISSIFLIFWLLLFQAIVVPLFNSLPNAKTKDESSKGVFIAQRAMENLYNLTNIGPKVVGSFNNENKTVQYLLNELALIKEQVLDDYFDIEIDHQQVSGSYIHWTMVNMYQGVQNLVVKLSPKNCTSDAYLLVNSHFDSKPTSPSAGGGGQMIATILEVLRVMSTTREIFQNPIVFLLNGAEENPMQGSHGFVTQHKWAKNCKAFLNLDGYGGGGRDLLFQSSPDQSWLVEYYKHNVKHPFATNLAEDILKVYSPDTDYSILTKYGNMSGLNLAQSINSFAYQTRLDNYNIIPSDSVQSIGDNVLSLVRALSNSKELQDIEGHAGGSPVFFDFLGLAVVEYSNYSLVNWTVALATIFLIVLYLFKISRVSNVSTSTVIGYSIPVLILQIFAFYLGWILPIWVAKVFDNCGRSLTYFSSPSLMFGLYVCPSLIGLCLPSILYMPMWRGQQPVSYARVLHLFVLNQALILAILAIYFTCAGYRSTYVIIWTLILFDLQLIINLIIPDVQYSWSGALLLFHSFSFFYVTYLQYTLLKVVTPMMGLLGRSYNPDYYIAVINAMGTILAMGFVIPLVNMFRRPFAVIVYFLVIFLITVILARTPFGFPYRPTTNVERVPYLHIRRTFFNYNGTISKDDSGYLFNFQDRHGPTPLENTVNLTGLVGISADCEKYMMCGYPLFDHHWVNSRMDLMWLPREKPIEPPRVPEVELLSKFVQADNKTIRYNFKINVTDHTSIFIQPYENVNVKNWTFPLKYIEHQSPYHIYFSYGNDNTPLSFFIDFAISNKDIEEPLFEMGVSGHFIGDKGDKISQDFGNSFPDFAAIIDWPTSYQQFIF